MRHTRILAIISASILATACSDPVNDIPDGNTQSGTNLHTVTLRATHDTPTRTDFDGTSTSWVDGDAMSVILDRNGEQQAVRFTLTDAAEGAFEGSIETVDLDAEYDIYAVYPYNEQKTTADNKNDKALFDIGSARQTQQRASASHVAAYDPLTGSVKAVSLDNISLRMHHTATLIRLDLHNATGSTISGITSATITAPTTTALAASHTIDLMDGSVEVAGEQMSNTIELTVEKSGEIAAGATFTLWAAAAPFEIADGQTLNIDITTADGGHFGAVKAFDKAKRFAAGTIMSTTVNLGTQSQTRTVSVDFTSTETYPDTFPMSYDAEPSTHTHVFDGLEFKFDCPGSYYQGGTSGNKRLIINDISQKAPARIYLPAIKGYAPTKIIVHNAESQSQDILISVTDMNGNMLDNTKDMTAYKQQNIYEPTGTNDTNTYCVYITCRQTNTGKTYRLQSLDITYTPYQAN